MPRCAQGQARRVSHERAAVNRGASGEFTLLELLVVIVILTLAGVLVLARGPAHSERLDMDAAVRRLAGGLRLARTEAIVHGRPVVFTLDAIGHSYRVDARPPVALPSSVGLELVNVSGVIRGERSAAISFASDGSSSGGQIELRGGGLHPRIRVDWLTGRVNVAD